MSGRNLAILLLATFTVAFWVLGYLRHSPLLDALGSVLCLIAIFMRWAKTDQAR